MKYATYSEYKPSPMAWLDQLPTHWNAASLRWMSKRYAGGTPDKGNEAYWEDGDIPWINSGAVNDGYITQPSELITREGFANSSAKWIPKDALVMALAGQGKTKGMVAQLGIPTTCNQSMAALIPDHRFAPRYLYYWLTANYQNIRNLAGGEARDGLNLEMLGSIPCPVPPVDEQQAIARFLDAKTTQIDALVAQKRQLIAKLKEKRQALIARTVTRGLPPEAAKAAGLEPNPEMKDSGVDWLGETPTHWGEDKVARLFRAMKGRNAAQLTKEYCATIEGEYPVYSGQTENDGVMSSIDEFEFDAGEDGYLFSTTVGAKAMSLMHLKGKFSLSQNCMVIAPMSDKVQVRFYYYHLQPLFQFERGLIPEHMQASFRMEDLYQYRVAIPPKDEQRAIADYLDQVCATADDLLEVTERAIVKLNEYRQALITSAVTGKIDVRELA